MILTDDEIGALDCETTYWTFARLVEKAILAKLAEGQEEIGEVRDDYDGHPWKRIACTSPNELAQLPVGHKVYANPSAELAALRAEVTSLKAKLAAAQAREQQLLEVFEKIENHAVNPWSQWASQALALPADRSALDAYLAPYKLDAENYRWIRDHWWFAGEQDDIIRAALSPDELDAAIAAAKEK